MLSACPASALPLLWRCHRWPPACQTPRQPPLSDQVTVTPAEVEPGSPEIIRVVARGASSVEGEWLGRKIEFFRTSSGEWGALAGVDVQAPEGPSTLHLRIKQPDGWAEVNPHVEIHPAHYRTGTLTVAPKFVSPGPAELMEIEAEIKLKNDVLAHSAPEPLWHGDFHAPVRYAPTDSLLPPAGWLFAPRSHPCPRRLDRQAQALPCAPHTDFRIVAEHDRGLRLIPAFRTEPNTIFVFRNVREDVEEHCR